MFLTLKKKSKLLQSFKMVADQMAELEQDTPLVKSHVARFGAQALVCGVATLVELAEPFHNGIHYPLFLLCLQAAHRVKDKQWLVSVFTDSKLNLQEMLPGKPGTFINTPDPTISPGLYSLDADHLAA